MTSAFDIILKIANKQLIQNEIRSGINGPHNDLETIVRNSCHWCVTFLNCYQWTGEIKYKKAALELINKVILGHQQSNNSTYCMRITKDKDSCNGLIGQAWVIEALVKAGMITNQKKYFNHAERLFLNHKYNHHLHLWHIKEIDGNIKSIDPTFNHQLWFAASISPILERNKEIKNSVSDFLLNIKQNITILNGGLIFHIIDRDLTGANIKNNPLKKILSHWGIRLSHIKMKLKRDPYFKKLMQMSYGYQCFNLYAFAHLKKNLPPEILFELNLDHSVKLLNKNFFHQLLENNVYAYPYNAPGFEVPYIEEVFHSDNSLNNRYFQKQIIKSFDYEKLEFNCNTEDPNTLTARIYELSQVHMENLKSLFIK